MYICLNPMHKILYSRFIGALFNVKMLGVNIMNECVVRLLRSCDRINLECLCHLFTIIGKEFDKGKLRVKTY